MAKCDITGKKRATGNNVSHAKNRNKRVFGANLQKVKVKAADGTVSRMTVSTSALKSSDDLLKPAPRKVILAQLKKEQES